MWLNVHVKSDLSFLYVWHQWKTCYENINIDSEMSLSSSHKVLSGFSCDIAFFQSRIYLYFYCFETGRKITKVFWSFNLLLEVESIKSLTHSSCYEFSNKGTFFWLTQYLHVTLTEGIMYPLYTQFIVKESLSIQFWLHLLWLEKYAKLSYSFLGY